MKIPATVLSLIKEEQLRQSGKFIPAGDAYLKKLENDAELLIHAQPRGCAGFVFFYCNDPEKKFSYITLLLTAPSARKSGIATALINYVLNITRQRGFQYCQLEVRKENLAALALYESIGFSPIEDRGEKYLMRAKIS